MIAGRGTEDTNVVLVHGLYMHGLAMLPLARRLTTCGFCCRVFSYPSLSKSVAQNADRLSLWLSAIEAPTVHFVCHSLGGILVRALLARSEWHRPGRVLTLGTPHLGCQVAKRLGAHAALAWTVGASLEHGLDGDVAPWPPGQQVATIAGARSIGLGRLVMPELPKPNDGVVAVAETDLGDEHIRAVLPVSHSGMLLSRTVAEYACEYLKFGRFPD